MRISDWSSDVCSSDLEGRQPSAIAPSSVLRAATSPWLRHREDQAGLRCLRLHANVAAMLKRFLPLAALVTFTLPSLVTAQGVTSSADPRATAAGRELLPQVDTAADEAVAMVAVRSEERREGKECVSQSR